MAYTLIKYKNQYDSEVREYQCEKIADISNLPTQISIPDKAATGSLCLCEEDGNVYILKTDGNWVALDPVTISTINDLTTGGLFPLSAEMGKALKALVDGKVAKSDIINDLTTGGATKVASAETVKALETNKLDKSAVVDTLDGDLTGKVASADVLKTYVSNSDLIAFTDETGKIQATNVKDALTELAAFHSPKYGVSGVGGITVDLTRLWDSVGKTANVGTDTQTAVNNFDGLAPFNRRKCVGDWATVGGKPVFTVQSYYGDPDFAEDGSKGNYVAVEIDPLWYYQEDFSQDNPYSISGVVGVSPANIYGWKPHPICLNANGTIRAKTYLPCYSLALKDGVAVSLPGYQNEWGSYYSLMTAAKTYNSASVLEPSIVRHYEWLLFTIEFATTNCQAIMAGASGMPYAATDTIALEASDTNAVVVTSAIGAKFVIGQTIYLGTTYSTSAAIADLNVITNIQNCLDNGTLDAGGTYRLITFDGTARSVTTATTISSRPWKTGVCNTVLTPSGCPSGATAPASANKYPMRYRYRENIWGNQYSTLFDFFAKLIGSDTVEDPYKLEWYYCIDKSYSPANVNKPDVTDFATAAFIKLPQTTEHVSGYIKSIAMDSDNPCVITPVVQTGASEKQYYSDYAYIVNGTTSVRAVRLGGAPYLGAYVGVLSFTAYPAPSYASWSYGGGLFIPQWGF